MAPPSRRKRRQPTEAIRQLWTETYRIYLHLGASLDALGVELGEERSAVAALDLRELSSRELEVVSMLRQVDTIQEVAQQLHISIHTARNHTKRIYQKLGVHSRAELMRRMADVHRG